MASVYYLFDDALHIADDIVEKYSQQDKNLKENHNAATIIQRTYRRYMARKSYKEHIRAAVVLQKYIKGWLVRYHLPDILQEYWDKVCLEQYNRAATKLQAAWRGLLVRNEICIKQIMKEKHQAEERAKELLGDTLDMDFQSDKQEKLLQRLSSEKDIPFGGVPFGHDMFLKEQILSMMFDRHHLLSTNVQKGILATDSELQEIEKILKALPWKDYTSKMKKMYYTYQKLEKDVKPAYIFENKKMRKQEELFKLRDKRNDVKEERMSQCTADKRKPFNLYSKLVRYPYERSFLREEVYINQKTMITRTEDKTKNICEKDFIFALKEVVKDCNVPPYYADFWYQKCAGHHFLD